MYIRMSLLMQINEEQKKKNDLLRYINPEKCNKDQEEHACIEKKELRIS